MTSQAYGNSSQVQHPSSEKVSPAHSLEATVTMEHQTFLMEALEQFLTQSPPPPHTYTHFSSYTQSVAFLVAPRQSLNLQ